MSEIDFEGWHSDPPKIGEIWRMASVVVKVTGFTEGDRFIEMVYLDKERKEVTKHGATVYQAPCFSKAWELTALGQSQEEAPQQIETETIQI